MREQPKNIEEFGVQFSDALQELQVDRNVAASPREYVLKDVPQAEDLQQLCDLNFEVSIWTIDQRVVLRSGSEFTTEQVSHIPESLSQEEADRLVQADARRVADLFSQSRINFHSHILHGDSNKISSRDYYGFLTTYKRNNYMPIPPMLIATPAGLVVTKIGEWVPEELILKAMDIVRSSLTLAYLNVRSLKAEPHEAPDDFRKRMRKAIDTEIDIHTAQVHEVMDTILEVSTIGWTAAQPVIDEHMNPANLNLSS